MARRTRSPQEKKQLSLAKDTPLGAKYPKAFRKKWPVKKARAKRSFRHAQRHALERDPDNDVPPTTRFPRKWGQATLGEVIVAKTERRAAVAANPRKSPAARARRQARRSRRRITSR